MSYIATDSPRTASLVSFNPLNMNTLRVSIFICRNLRGFPLTLIIRGI